VGLEPKVGSSVTVVGRSQCGSVDCKWEPKVSSSKRSRKGENLDLVLCSAVPVERQCVQKTWWRSVQVPSPRSGPKRVKQQSVRSREGR